MPDVLGTNWVFRGILKMRLMSLVARKSNLCGNVLYFNDDILYKQCCGVHDHKRMKKYYEHILMLDITLKASY
jgi:hypothetical protein